MLTRTVSGIVIFIILLVSTILGGQWLKLLVSFLILVGIVEVYKAFSKNLKSIHYVGITFSGIYILNLDKIYDSNVLFVIIVLFVFSVLCCLVIFHQKLTPIDAFVTIFGFIYVTIMMSTIYLVREFESGWIMVWLIFISAWGCDTGAYFVGVLFGKHKLIPTLSPKKTVEGSIGGILVATIVGGVFGFAVTMIAEPREFNIIALSIVACLIGSVLAQFGDLTASSIKRYTGIKDYGKVIPGHGGIIDRFDSVLFTAPAVYVVLVVFFS